MDSTVFALLATITTIDSVDKIFILNYISLIEGKTYQAIRNGVKRKYFKPLIGSEEYLVSEDFDPNFDEGNVIATHIITRNQLQMDYPSYTDYAAMIEYERDIKEDLSFYYYNVDKEKMIITRIEIDEFISRIEGNKLKKEDDKLINIQSLVNNLVRYEPEIKLISAENIGAVLMAPMLDEKQFLSKINKIMKKISELIGLEEVKKFANDLVNCVYYDRFCTDNTPDEIEQLLSQYNSNMLFLGEPGTGKTTVSKLMAELLKELGLISSSKITFITPDALIGKYVGHSEANTKELIAQNEGGVIVLDEAYQLAIGERNFSGKVLPIILKEMEKSSDTSIGLVDKKNKVSFIFLGYKKEMEELIEMNSGFISRVPNKIEFKNYKEEELYQIVVNRAKKQFKALSINEEAEAEIKRIIKLAIKQDNFGNARFAEGLINKIINQHKTNVVRDKRKDDFVITLADISSDILQELGITGKQKTIGFSMS